MNSKNTSTAILGAGITGLNTAYALQKKGIDVTIYEKENHAGGVIQTQPQNDWLVEKGPNTMLVRDQQIWDLLDELGLTNQILKPGPEAKKRYIIRNKKLCPAPMSLTDFLKTDLFSTQAKFRLLKEPFIEAPSVDDESIADFIHRRLGSEPLDYAANPFVSGIYAGDPDALSIKHTFGSLFEMEQEFGSITKGFFKRDKKKSSAQKALISFKNGMQSLPNALHKKLEHSIQLNSSVQDISTSKSGWTIRLDSGQQKNHKSVVSTIPPFNLAKIWHSDYSHQPINKLTEISYAPMSVLGLGFKREQINHPLDGFGMLIPEVEPFTLLGGLFSSSLFPNRAPENHALLTCFIGGDRHPKLAGRSTEKLLAEVMPQLRKLLDVDGRPVFQQHAYWPKAIPQYRVGYDEHLAAMDEVEQSNPGFFLAGNYRGGVSVPDCILNGFEAAGRVDKYLNSGITSSP